MMYNMKRGMIIIAALCFSISAGAQQTLDNGIKMYKYNKLQSAQAILAPLAATDPVANYYLGLSYLGMGNISLASTTFSKYPDDPANISGTARVAFANNDAAKGMQIARDLAAKAKKKEWLPMKYAADAIANSKGGDYRQAITWYTEVLTKTDDPEVHIALGDCYRKVPGGGGEAMNNYEHVTEKDPKNSLVLSHIGDLWYEAQNYPSALNNYAKAKDADASNPLPYKSVGEAYARSGKYQLALQNLKQYITLSDNSLNDKVEYLGIQYEAKSFCDAAKYAQDLIGNNQLTPEQKITVTGVLGFSLSECGDSILAIQYLHQYFQIQNPAKIKAGDYLELGKLYLKMGQLDSAGYYYNKGIAGDTAQNKTDIYRQIAEAYKTRKDYCKSADWYNNLVKANPNTQPLDYTWRGIMYYYCNDLDKAIISFNDFATKYPDQPYDIYWQGRTSSAIDSNATTGLAVPYFVKWIDKVGPDYEKKNDLKGAYEYLLYYYYNSKDKENENAYKEKIRKLDPADKALLSIEEAEKQAATPAKKPGSKK